MPRRNSATPPEKPASGKPGRQLLPAVSPLRGLTPEDLGILETDPDTFFARRRCEYILAHQQLAQLSPNQASRYSFGYQVIQRELDRVWPYLFPKRLEVNLHAEMRTSTDRELIELALAVGALPATVIEAPAAPVAALPPPRRRKEA